MKPLYTTAAMTYSGKTALALGIGLKLQAEGYKIGYLKPISTQPFMVDGNLADEDSVVVRRACNLDTPLSDMSPVIIDEALFETVIQGTQNRDFKGDIKNASQKPSRGKAALRVEAGASMPERASLGTSAITDA